MVNYANGCIYKLCCKDTNIKDIYVGSTTNFRERKRQHKNFSNSNCNRKVYNFINENGGWNNWDMIEIIKYSCNDKRELETKEREYIELLNSTLNHCIPTRSKKEYREDNKEHFKELWKKRYELKKDEYKKKSKEWYNNNLDRVKKKREDNKEHKKELWEKWYSENGKDRIRKKIKCDICNIEFRSDYLNRHNKTKSHLKNIEE